MPEGVIAFDAIWSSASRIGGWLTPEQARMLYEAARWVPPGGRALEIGSHHGKSTVVTAAGLADGARLVAIDPFDDPRWGGGQQAYETFRENLQAAGVADRIELFRGLSAEALAGMGEEPLDLVFIDGAHDFDSVRLDIDGWGARLRVGGQLLIHDSFSSIGVTRALLSRLAIDPRFVFVERAGSLARFTREATAQPGARAVSALRTAVGLAYFGRNVAVKLLLRRDRADIARRMLGHTQQGDPY